MNHSTRIHRAAPGPTLRRDLTVLDGIDAASRYRIVLCEISGKFTRTTTRAWQQLAQGTRDAPLWNDAAAAGWTRQRRGRRKQRFSLLAVRVPLGSVDRLASYLASRTSVFFSPAAVIAWCIGISLTALAVLSNGGILQADLAGLPAYLANVNPLIPGSLFVVTKVMHELGHAVMCRRLGSRCGSIGILFLCGMPCPYCEVTDIWREPSSFKRAAVMLAGIYIELIMAMIASLVWMISGDPDIRLAAINVMLICSVSTILFNANPLMRYDGYYVLSDLIGTVNLRQEASQASDRLMSEMFTGRAQRTGDWSSGRARWLAVYHVASLVYRVVVMLAIAGLIIKAAAWVHLPMIGFAIVSVGAINSLQKMFR